MRIAKNWKDFELLDTSGGDKLERWGEYILARPDPQILWHTEKVGEWSKAHARYLRSSTGGGHWESRLPRQEWQIGYNGLRFHIRPTNFKHTGLFPEQAVNWDFIEKKIGSAGHPVKALNLFAYTGGATLACARAGAEVCHVDASKGMVTWARENAELSGLAEKPVRWIVDDCIKFAQRELRRGNRYEGIVMDPPSYGRGPGGEVWKLESAVYDLVELCSQLLSDKPLFFMLNSYTTGLSAGVMEYLLGTTVGARFRGRLSSSEIGLPVTSTGMSLPCGTTAIWERD